MFNITFDLSKPLDDQKTNFLHLKDFLEEQGISIVGAMVATKPRSVPSSARTSRAAGPIEQWYLQSNGKNHMRITDPTLTREQFAKKMCAQYNILIPVEIMEDSEKWEKNDPSIVPAMHVASDVQDDDESDDNPLM